MTAPSTASVVTTDISAAGKGILAAVAVLVPGAGEVVAIVAAVLALAPVAEPEIEAIIALLEGKKASAAPYVPVTPGIAADDAALLAALPK
jgi:hypothetical protein